MSQKLLKNISYVAVISSTLYTLPAWGQDEKKHIKEPESDWEFSVGAGVSYSPDYEGSDDYEAGFMPNVEVVWKDRVSLSMGGLEVDVFQSEHLTFGLGVGYGGGRDEKDNDALKGLGDIDSSFEGSVYASYQADFFELGANFSQDLGDGHEGSTLGLEANFYVPIFDEVMIMVGPDMTWASDDYMQSYFGITSKQAANSVYSKYNAGSGIKDVGLHMMAEYPITESVSLRGMLEYKKLVGDAADSPLVKDKGADNQVFGGLMLNYSF